MAFVTTWSEDTSDVWEAALTTEPTNIWFNGTLGTEESDAISCDAANEWFWESNVLYVYSTSDPDTAYVAPGISTHPLVGGNQLKMFQSMEQS